MVYSHDYVPKESTHYPEILQKLNIEPDELEKENEEHQQNALLRIKAFEEQIEKMKKCANCKHFDMEFIPYWCNKNSEYRNCWEKCGEWELAEN